MLDQNVAKMLGITPEEQKKLLIGLAQKIQPAHLKKENKSFVERKAYKLELISFNEEACLILKGNPRVGKTEILKHYYFQNKDHYDVRLWIDASSDSTLQSTVALLQTYFKESSTDKVSLVVATPTEALNQLSLYLEKTKLSWLLVIDGLYSSELYPDLPEVDDKLRHHLLISHLPSVTLPAEAPTAIHVSDLKDDVNHDEFIEELYKKTRPKKALDPQAGSQPLTTSEKQTIHTFATQVNYDLPTLIFFCRYIHNQATPELLGEIGQLTTEHQYLAYQILFNECIAKLSKGQQKEINQMLSVIAYLVEEFIPISWFNLYNQQQSLEKLMELKLIDKSDETKTISLSSHFHTFLLKRQEQKTPAEQAKDYQAALEIVSKGSPQQGGFEWKRVRYLDEHGEKKHGDATYESKCALHAKKVADYFKQIVPHLSAKEKADCALLAAELYNSIGRYYYYLHAFHPANPEFIVESYSAAKLLIETYLINDDPLVKSLHKDISATQHHQILYQKLKSTLKIYVLYATEVLHNIGSVLTRAVSQYEKETQTDKNKQAIDFLRLSECLQRCRLQDIGTALASQQKEEDYKAMYHTVHNLARAYRKQGDIKNAKKAYDKIFKEKDAEDYYRNTAEGQRIALADYAVILRVEVESKNPKRRDDYKIIIKDLKDAVQLCKPASYPKNKIAYDKAMTLIYLAEAEMSVYQHTTDKEEKEESLENMLKHLKEAEEYNQHLSADKQAPINQSRIYFRLAWLSQQRQHMTEASQYLDKALLCHRALYSERAHPYLFAYQIMQKELNDYMPLDATKVRQFKIFLMDTLIRKLQETVDHEKDIQRKKTLALNIVADLSKLIPPVEISLKVLGADAKATFDLSKSVEALCKTLAEHTKEISDEKIVKFKEDQTIILKNLLSIVNSLIEGRQAQLSQLNEEGLAEVITHIVNSIVNYIQKGKLEPRSPFTLEQQLQTAIFLHKEKSALMTINPIRYHHWTVYGFFNQAGIQVVQKTQDKSISHYYTRSEDKAENDKHRRYGYIKFGLNSEEIDEKIRFSLNPPLTYDRYDSEVEADRALEKSEAGKKGCVIL